MTSRPAAVTSNRRGLWLAVIGCAVAAAALVLAAGQVWLRVSLPPNPPLPGVNASFTGAQVADGLVPLGILAGAAGLALIAGRRVVRLAVGSVLVLTGLLTVGGIGLQIDDEGWVTAFSWAQRYQQDASLESIFPDRDFSAAPAWLALAGGGVILAVGMMTILGSSRWPVMGARFESRAGRGGDRQRAATQGSPTRAAASGPVSEASMWAAIERGEDPTESRAVPRSDETPPPTPDEPVSDR